ncbi:multidrug and toxin extrusion protein 1-like isoform X4 [Epinephelus lanceolatus]|uniref:multidrug and toxin extrusion protein 1-like isoform X3 n=1 Tax=Epinephelus lanceolatus TaxID=310571 RepID=UPI0014463B6B|nr:multidrug and toxin extrusion protein 1-like isoform X3 [Epinephelus lanceolatus]
MDGPATHTECNGMNGASTAAVAAPCAQGSGEGCLKRVGGFVPPDYRNEIVQVVKLAGPVVFSQLMFFLIGVISLVFCGHLGKTELAGVSLAAVVVNVTGMSIGAGLSCTCDTLISQTYGSGNLKRVGVILQRGVLILLLACFPCWAVLINTEALLLAVKQSPEVASLSQLYVKIFMPALPAAFMYQLQGKYLQNQGIMWPQVITGLFGNVLNAIINYVFLYPLELGVAGSAAANAISQYVLAVVLYIYIYWRGLHKATWGVIVACFVGTSLSISRCVIGYIFTSEQDIIQRVADVMVIFGFMHICDATAGAAAGVLRGTGKQLTGALCNLVGFYFIGFPTGVSLMFAANMGIVGLWTGLAIGVSLQMLVFVTFLCKLDWEKAAEEALVRAGVKITEEKEMVELEDTDLKQEGDANLEVHDSGHSRLQFTTTTVGHLLSVKQLVLRRGLTLLIMIVILTVGIVTSSLLVKQFK